MTAALVASAFPAVAGATDYCVKPATGCAVDVQTFRAALDAADNAPDADRIFLGESEYAAPDDAGFQYLQGLGPVEIAGKGAGRTVLTGPSGAGESIVSLSGAAGTSIHDLTIKLPENAVGLGALQTKNTARRIEVIEAPTQSSGGYRLGVELETGGTLEDSTVTLASSPWTRAVWFTTPGTVRRSTLSAGIGLASRGGTIERSRVTGSESGVEAHSGVTKVSGSLIRVTGAAGDGIVALSQAGLHTTVEADGVTIVGPGLGTGSGASVGLEPAVNDSADISLVNSIIRGTSRALYASDANGTGNAKIVASYSDYDPSGNLAQGAHAAIDETNVFNVGDARFANAAGGDYRLLPGSPLVDVGDPAAAQGLDLAGNPLVADGNGDGGARRDLGAFELQPAAAGGAGGFPGGTPATDTQPPLIGGFRAEPSVFAVARATTPLAARVARGTRFRYTLSEAGQVRVKIQRALAGRRQGGRCVRPSRRLRSAKRCTRYRTVGTLKRSGLKGANRIRFSGRLGKRALRPGAYRAVIRATDAAGNRSAPKRIRLRVRAT